MLAASSNMGYVSNMEPIEEALLKAAYKRWRTRFGQGAVKHAAKLLGVSRQHLFRWSDQDETLGYNYQVSLRDFLEDEGFLPSNTPRAEEPPARYSVPKVYDPIEEFVRVVEGFIPLARNPKYSFSKRLDLVESNLKLMLALVPDVREANEPDTETPDR